MLAVIDTILRRPVLVIFAFLTVTAAALHVHVTHSEFDFTFANMAPRGTIQYQRFEEFNAEFGAADSAWLLVWQSDDAFSGRNLALTERLTEQLEALDGTGTVLSLTNALDIRGSDAGLAIDDYVGPLPLDEATRDAARQRVENDPVVGGLLVSRDGRSTAIVTRLEEWSTDPMLRVAYFQKVDAILEAAASENTAFHMAGLPYTDSVLVGHINSDTSILIPLTAVFAAVLLWLVFGRLRATWLPLLPVIIASVWTLGALTGAGRPMTLLTGQGVLTTLIMVIGLSDGVHLLNRYLEDRSAFPNDAPETSLRRSIVYVGRACFLTSLTTAIGFLSLAGSELPTIRDFGVFGACGIVFAYIAALVLMPATMVLFERRKPLEPRNQRAITWIDAALERVTGTVHTRPKFWLSLGIALMVASGLLATLIEIDGRYTRDLRSEDPAVLAQDFVEENIGGSQPLEIVIEGQGPDTIKQPVVLATIERIRDGLLELDWVTEATSPAEFVRKMNFALHDEDPTFDKIPDSAEAVAQCLLLFEMGGGDNEFDRLVTYDYSKARISLMMRDGPPELYYATIERLHELTATLPPGLSVYESAETPMFYSAMRNLVTTLMASLYLALPIIVFVIAVAFRSVRDAIISVVPNILPLTFGAGFLGLTAISLRFSTIVPFPVALGLAVDDTIHFLVRYREERRGGATPAQAVETTLKTTGRAMVMTTLFLVGGYQAFLASNFLAAVHMGIVTSAILLVALFGDLLVLPSLMLLFDRDHKATGAKVAFPSSN